MYPFQTGPYFILCIDLIVIAIVNEILSVIVSASPDHLGCVIAILIVRREIVIAIGSGFVSDGRGCAIGSDRRASHRLR